MWGGKVVPPFDSSITNCGYCGRKLVWRRENKGGTEESYAKEDAAFKAGYPPFLVFGPPYVEWSYGCPMYGKGGQGALPGESLYSDRMEAINTGKPWDSGLALPGWHFHWIDQSALYNAIRERM